MQLILNTCANMFFNIWCIMWLQFVQVYSVIWASNVNKHAFAAIPLPHYSRNAPRIHNVGHFFQIAKVPSGVSKSCPAFVLDSATFVAIAKCSQTQLRVGNLFHFPQNSWVHWEPNTTKIPVYEYDTIKQERKTTLVRTFVRIYCDMVENERNVRRLYYESYDPYTNVIWYWRYREELGNNVVRFT